MNRLLEYHWPGNVRELRAAVDHGVVLATGPKITLRDLPLAIRQWNGEPGGAASGANRPAGKNPASVSVAAADPLNIQQREDALIRRAMEETGGNITEAARKLGISRRTLHRKLKPKPPSDTPPDA